LGDFEVEGVLGLCFFRGEQKTDNPKELSVKNGGDIRDRTVDPYTASVMLSQLSYAPVLTVQYKLKLWSIDIFVQFTSNEIY
jgi:hypothetical protein